MRECWGGTKSAPCGPRSPPPIHTCSVRHRPAMSGSVSTINAWCIVRIDAASSRSARASAASIARVFATICAALRLLVTPISASAMARADAVRFSIWELAADSARSENNGGAYSHF